MWPRLRPGSYYGATVRAYRTGEIALTESAYPPRSAAPKHAHEHAFCYLMLSGSCTETYGSRVRTVAAPHLVFHPAGATHANRWHAAGGGCFHVEFGPDWLRRVREHTTILDEPSEFRQGPPVWLAARLYGEFREPDALSPLAIEGLTLELVARAARHSNSQGTRRAPSWLRRAEETLAERFRDPPRVSELARSVGVHPVHLVTVFRRQIGCTPGDYVRRRRVEYACGQLARTAASLTEIAFDAGFCHQSHFCRLFKTFTGMTPGHYRRLFRSHP
jgi:AraC family transcriptional regulator